MLYLDPDGSPKSISHRELAKESKYILLTQFRSRFKADLYNEAHPEKERTWTSNKGKEIIATLINISGNTITVNKGDKEYVLTTDKLSAKDVDYLRSWLNARDISDQSLVR